MSEASVIIATRDRSQRLRDCLRCLTAQSAQGRFEIIVIDNGSTDDTPSVIEDFAKHDVRRIFVGQPNRAKARNVGVAAASSRIIIFCDDDTLAPEHYVGAHIEAHGLSGRYAVSGPIVNVPDGRESPLPGARHYSRAFFCTCNVSVAKAELEAVKGFDERYDLYGWEDTDVGLRLRKRGVRRVFVKEAYLYHVKPVSVSTFERRVALAREKGAMAARLVRKLPSWRVKFATGAYAANFARAAFFKMMPLGPVREMLARQSHPERSAPRRFVENFLIDAAYTDSLRSALRQRDG